MPPPLLVDPDRASALAQSAVGSWADYVIDESSQQGTHEDWTGSITGPPASPDEPGAWGTEGEMINEEGEKPRSLAPLWFAIGGSIVAYALLEWAK